MGNLPATGDWVGLGKGLNVWVCAGSEVGWTSIPPGPVALGVYPGAYEVDPFVAYEDRAVTGRDEPVVPKVKYVSVVVVSVSALQAVVDPKEPMTHLDAKSRSH